jgi:hypothetical protein
MINTVKRLLPGFGLSVLAALVLLAHFDEVWRRELFDQGAADLLRRMYL